jgi:transposase InsO family protein
VLRGGRKVVEVKERRKVRGANNSPINIECAIETSLKLGGVDWPATFVVAEKLVYDVIIGLDLLEAIDAVIDTRTKTLILFDGMSSLPMTNSGEHLIVKTTEACEIPAFSEAIILVNCAKKLNHDSEYYIERDVRSPCKKLFVARTLVNARNKILPCRVMNATEKAIKLKTATPIGVLAVAEVLKPQDMSDENQTKPEVLTTAEKQAALEAKKVSLKDTVLKGADFVDLVNLLYDNIDLFATSLKDLPGCDLITHKIDTGSNPPVAQRSFRQSPEMKKEIEKQIQDMLDANIIEESTSPFNANILMICKKPDPQTGLAVPPRMVFDYRGLNSITKLVHWPIPTFPEIIDTLAVQKPTLYTVIDQKAGYNNAYIHESDRCKTAFDACNKHYQYRRLAMGLCGAVETFQRLMQECLKGLTPDICFPYLDDLLVWANGPTEMISRLTKIFDRFRSCGLRMHPSKCNFAVDRVLFLGHVLEKDGISVNQDKIKIVKNFPCPRTPKQIKSFLGLAAYYKKFVKQFSQISAPLRRLLQKDVKFEWSSDCQSAFETLKNALITSPILAMPDFERQFILTTDSSTASAAWILSQKDHENRERVVSYGGRSLRKNETKWSVSELECLALVEGVREFHVYLASRPFLVVTDHSALTFIQRMKLCDMGNNRLTRWALFLQSYNFEIVHKKGSLLTSADAISRIPYENVTERENKPIDDEDYEELIASVSTLSDEPMTDRVNLIFDSDEESAECVAPIIASADLPSLDEIKLAVASCPDFAAIYEYLDNGTLPINDEQARRTVFESQEYVLDDRVLYHLFTPRTKRIDRAIAVIRQVCVPRQFRQRVADAMHVGTLHAGFDRLYASMRTRFYWPRLYSYLHDFITSCVDCQKCKRPAHKERVPIGTLGVSPPLTKFTMDFHGPFNESNGMKYILVFICCTSGWVELIPTRDTSAKTVVRCLFDNIISRFGIPRGLSLQSDCGSGFIAALTRLCCKTFGIKQIHSVPYHANPQARCESFADIIHKSLRLVCKDQSQWSEHVQSIAYSYRATSTTSVGLSPFHIVFGKSMVLPLDLSAGAPEVLVHSAEAYSEEIGPKLAILHQIAQQNSIDSASYQRRRVNQSAKLPKYQAGDKVLVYNPTTKTGECKKLKIRYEPFVIKETLPGFTYKLQNIETGIDVKRAVHANRLRPFIERANEAPPSDSDSTIIYDGKLSDALQVTVVLADIVNIRADALVCFIDKSLLPVGETSDRILTKCGAEVIQEQMEIAQLNIGTELPSALLTKAGSIESCDNVIHAVTCREIRDLKSKVTDVFTLADESVSKLAMPFADFYDSEAQLWAISQDYIDAAIDFQKTMNTSSHLSQIIIVCNALIQADTLNVVCGKLIGVATEVQSAADPLPTVPNEATEPLDSDGLSKSTQWHAIKEVLKRRKIRNKVMYLVRWEEDDSTSWVPRKDLTDAAIQSFLANQSLKKKTRRQ